MKKSLILFGKSLLILVVGALVGILLLSAVYLIPSDALTENLKRSAPIFVEEEIYPTDYSWCSSLRDNWTDALILMISSENMGKSTLENVLQAYTPTATIEGEELDPVLVFIMKYSGMDNSGISFGSFPYTRYWHGYRLVIRPLLAFLDLSGIRILNGVVQVLLAAAVCILMWFKKQRKLILPFLLCYAALIPPVLARSLQFSDIYYIFCISSLVLLFFGEKWKGRRSEEPFCLLFLLTGMCTSYFDFLTYPLVSFGIPVCICLMLNKKEDLKQDLLLLLRLLFYWGMGYVGFWAAKWILCDLFFHEGTIRNSLDTILFRSFLNVDKTQYGKDLSIIDAIWKNFCEFYGNAFSFYTMIAAGVMTVFAVILRKKYGVRNLVIYGIIALLPFVWFSAAANHSGIHFWMTNKELVITSFALMCAASDLFDKSGVTLFRSKKR